MLVLIFLAVDTEQIVSSGAVYGFVPLIVVMIGVARTYLHLRKRSRPKDVSLKRIRTIVISSFVLGLIWAMTTLAALPGASSQTAVILIMASYIFATTSLITSPSIPLASLGCAAPILIANAIGPIVFDQLPLPLIALITTSFVAVFGFASFANWQQTYKNVSLQVANQEAEVERAELMQSLAKRLSKYISPQLAESILSGAQVVEVAAQRKKLTVFFSDIAGFTEITERLESEELTGLLNTYFTEMSGIALAHGGTIDKFIGDAIVVFFGDPETRGTKADADACVRMAFAMQARMAALKAEWLELGLEDTFDLRIGINTGYCTVGNFGSDEKMDYTIIGSAVNLAARLETAADVGGILVSNETYALVKDWVDAEEAAAITAKGFARPIKTFSLKTPGETSQVIAHKSPHLALSVAPHLMNITEKADAAAVLQAALLRIRTEEEPP
ncbi:MAG: adenylate/guanylate cyclase domain-containing protein [Pseudomonadota bacterium]